MADMSSAVSGDIGLSVACDRSRQEMRVAARLGMLGPRPACSSGGRLVTKAGGDQARRLVASGAIERLPRVRYPMARVATRSRPLRTAV